MDHLPIDITTTIFTRHFITTQQLSIIFVFFLCHLDSQPQFPRPTVHRQPRPCIYKCSQINLSLPFQVPTRFVGSCIGMFCFHSWDDKFEGEGEFMWVSNPATPEYVILLELKFFQKSLGNGYIASGFGLAPSMNELKVVNAFHPWKPDTRVLTLGSNAWRSIGGAPNDCFLFGRQVFLDVSVYWLNYSYGGFGYGPYIIGITSFDFESEIFKSIPSPDFGLRKPPPEDFVIPRLLDGSLCITDNSSGDVIDIWVMKENDVWIKQFAIMKEVMDGKRAWVLSFICVGKNGELILLGDLDLVSQLILVSYNTETVGAVPLETDGLAEYIFC